MCDKQSEIALQPRPGLRGAWDKFIGPGASALEEWVALVPAFLFSMVILSAAYYKQVDWHSGLYIAAWFLAFDMVGGIATTATKAAKRWYHRPGRTWRNHAAFIAPHIAHIALFSWLFVEHSVLFFICYTSLLLIGTIVILISDVSIRRSVAHTTVFLIIAIGQQSFAVDPLMVWFVPALFIKLFASYLPPHSFQSGEKV